MNISLGLLIKILLVIFYSFSLHGEVIEKKYASFKLLNKTTNKVSQKEILVNSFESWETLKIEVLFCASSPPTEISEDYVLISVHDLVNKQIENIYTGWMISSSPGVTPLENPIYDLWLVGCIDEKTS